VSGNLTVFYAIGISLFAFGLPYLFIEYLRNKKIMNETNKTKETED
jgi:hypothetical protein